MFMIVINILEGLILGKFGPKILKCLKVHPHRNLSQYGSRISCLKKVLLTIKVERYWIIRWGYEDTKSKWTNEEMVLGDTKTYFNFLIVGIPLSKRLEFYVCICMKTYKGNINCSYKNYFWKHTQTELHAIYQVPLKGTWITF